MIIPDDVIADAISKGATTTERLDLFFDLIRDMGVPEDAYQIHYHQGYVALGDFCLQNPADVERLNEWVTAMGVTCQIKSITETGKYSKRIPNAKLYNIVLIRPESPVYQLVWKDQC